MPTALLDAPERPRVSSSRYRRWTWWRQVVASGLRLAVLALLAFLGWSAWYLANNGFSRHWRTTVAEELRKRGVEASVRRLTLDPFRGLIAQDLRIYDFKNRDKPLALISEVSLDINYAALLHGQPFLNALVCGMRTSLSQTQAVIRIQRERNCGNSARTSTSRPSIFISQAEGVFWMRGASVVFPSSVMSAVRLRSGMSRLRST